MIADLACKTCAYWEPLERGTVGTCHRNPPQLTTDRDTGKLIARWPNTQIFGWCGEHATTPEDDTDD